jgi:[ribosomal protein S18]-alanine N-acetyltransferase
MSIRHATPADIPAMMALEKRAATAAHWSAEQYDRVFSNGAPSRVLLIVEEESTLQAFVAGRVLDQEWEIENLAVAALARRRGLGSRLLGEFIEMARSRHAEAVFLEVRESNLAARRLYEKWAFVESRRRKRYYREPDEDAIIYQLSFS